jgi:hypothetical protein
MADGLPDGTRLVVTAGDPTAVESLAVLLALDAARRADAPAAPAAPARRAAWVRAARQEGVGGPPAATSSDLGAWGRGGG